MIDRIEGRVAEYILDFNKNGKEIRAYGVFQMTDNMLPDFLGKLKGKPVVLTIEEKKYA